MELSAALPALLVTLREGVEAALAIAIVVAYLTKTQQTSLIRFVYGGIAAGVAGSAAIGYGLERLVLASASGAGLSPLLKPVLEGSLCVVAIAMLTWMLLWMTAQGKALKQELESHVAAVLAAQQSPAWGMFGLAAVAVTREGFEVALFLASQFQEGTFSLLGAIAGLVGAIAFGVALIGFGLRLNLRRFFQVTGMLLLLVVGSLAIAALKQLDAAIAVVAAARSWACPSAPDSCVLGGLLWDARHVLPERGFPGALLKALFGYRDRLYAVQALSYVTFLAMAGTAYLRTLAGKPALPSVKRAVSKSIPPA